MIRDFSTVLTVLLVWAAPIAVMVAPNTTHAETSDPEWCLRDAPGLYRKLRRDARRAGEPVVCPDLEPAINLPKRLVLSLPCDRKISFARVDVSVKYVLDNAVTPLGGASGGGLTSYTQGLREATISGTFSLAGDIPSLGYKNLDKRAYYIAEYELTQLQYDLLEKVLPKFSGVKAPDAHTEEFLCKSHREQANKLEYRRILPKVELTKFKVDEAIRNLNLYLMAESRRQIDRDGLPLVPWEQGSTGYVRLPTEAEWEYASRGGPEADLNSDTSQIFFALEGERIRRASLEEVAVVADEQSRSQMRAVGTRLPNQLGIYDMIGNAEELVLDLFQLVVLGRDAAQSQGASGGLVLRGGHALTPQARAQLSHGYRQELPPYSLKNGEAQPAYMGVRLVISAPLMTTGTNADNRFSENLINTDLETAIITAREAQHTTRQGTAGAAARAKAVALIADMRDESDTDSLATQLDQLKVALERSEEQINKARSAELRSTARAAAMGIMNAHANSTLTVSVYEARYRAFKGLAQVPSGSGDFTRLKDQLAKMQDAIDVRIDLIGFQTRVVLDLVRDLARADPALADPAVQTVKEELRNQGLFVYDQRAWPTFDKAYATFRQDPSRDVFKEFVDLMDTRRTFRESRRRKELDEFPNLTR